MRAPGQLQRELDALSSVTLAADERATVQLARNWLAAYRAGDELLTTVAAIDAAIPSDAGKIAQTQTKFVWTTSADRQVFVDDLDSVLRETLRDTSCSLASELIDDEAEAVAADAEPVFRLTVLDELIAQANIKHQLEEMGWKDVEAGLDLAATASQTVATAKSYVDGVAGIVEAPNAELLAANVAYFRLCITKK